MKHFLLVLFAITIFPQLATAEIRLELISQIESSNNPNAYNAKGDARGLFQITPVCLLHYNNVHRTRFDKRDLFKAEVNKKIAQWYIGWLAKQLGDDERVLVGFNAGIKKARKWDGNIRTLNRETMNYVLSYKRLSGRNRK